MRSEGYDAQIAIISRGTDMSVVLTSLIAQDVRLPVHVVADRLPGKRDGFLLDTLRRTGAPVSLSLQSKPGVGHARYEVAQWLEACTVICLDDDAMLYPHTALRQLYEAAQEHSFATPIIRYVHNFEGTGMPGHEEIWETVSESDPRVQRALAANGNGWRRVYDFGTDQYTDDLGGTAFACDSQAYERAVKGLNGWQGGGEDHYLGKQLVKANGPGLVLTGVYAFHVGLFTPGKWGFDQVGLQYCRDNPEDFRKRMIPDDPQSLRERTIDAGFQPTEVVATGPEPVPTGIHGGQTLPVSERAWSPAVQQRLGFQAT